MLAVFLQSNLGCLRNKKMKSSFNFLSKRILDEKFEHFNFIIIRLSSLTSVNHKAQKYLNLLYTTCIL